MTQTLAPPATDFPDDRVAGRVVIGNVPWNVYSSLLESIGDGRTRLTYDHGLLEITVPSRHHEQVSEFVGALVQRSLERAGLNFEPSGSATWRQPEAQRGLEADKCFHIQNVDAVLGKVELDLEVDPPPDLVIEVELTSTSINKLPIYAGMRVPEVWRVLGDGSVSILLLRSDGTYAPADRSGAISKLTPALLSKYVQLREQIGHRAAVARFDTELFPPAK